MTRENLSDESAAELFAKRQALGQVDMQFVLSLTQDWFYSDDKSVASVAKLGCLIARLDQDQFRHLLSEAESSMVSFVTHLKYHVDELGHKASKDRKASHTTKALELLASYRGDSLELSGSDHLRQCERILLAIAWSNSPPSVEEIKR